MRSFQVVALAAVFLVLLGSAHSQGFPADFNSGYISNCKEYTNPTYQGNFSNGTTNQYIQSYNVRSEPRNNPPNVSNWTVNWTANNNTVANSNGSYTFTLTNSSTNTTDYPTNRTIVDMVVVTQITYYNSTTATNANKGPCKVCNDGYTLSTDGNVCYACAANCQTCNAQNGACTQCAVGYGLLANSAGVAANCAACPIYCTACDLVNNKCNTCAAGYNLVNNLCIRCPTNCVSCSTPNVCTQCANDFAFRKEADGSVYCDVYTNKRFLSGAGIRTLGIILAILALLSICAVAALSGFNSAPKYTTPYSQVSQPVYTPVRPQPVYTPPPVVQQVPVQRTTTTTVVQQPVAVVQQQPTTYIQTQPVAVVQQPTTYIQTQPGVVVNTQPGIPARGYF